MGQDLLQFGRITHCTQYPPQASPYCSTFLRRETTRDSTYEYCTTDSAEVARDRELISPFQATRGQKTFT